MTESEVSSKPILLLIDGHSLAFRSFYAFSKGGEGGLATKEGKPTSVTYGFLKTLLEISKNISPMGICIAFDTAEPTFRHKADSNYKANRDVAPEKFFQDLEQLQDILSKDLNIPLKIYPGYEADDVLGTLANKATLDGWKVLILSGDRDLFQLVDDTKDIAVMYMGGGPYSRSSGPKLIKESGVIEKLGVEPKVVIDLKALTGDSSDNIPGVKGVGPKTAINLLKENGNLDGVYKTLNELTKQGDKAVKGAIKGAIKIKLINDKENAYLSRYLAEIITDVPIEFEQDLNLSAIDSEGFKNKLESLELNSLAKQIDLFSACLSEGGFIKNKNKIKDQKESFTKTDVSTKYTNNSLFEINPEIVISDTSLNNLVKRLESSSREGILISIDTETTNLNPFKAELVGIGFCWGEGQEEIAYIPISHKKSLGESNKIDSQLSIEKVLKKISPWLENPDFPKALQNAKYDRLILMRHGISLRGVSIDTLLADYILDPNSKHSLEELAQREFNIKPKTFEETVPKGGDFSDVDIRTASIYCGMDVYLTRKLSFILERKLKKESEYLIKLLKEIELPLEPVLAKMEATGINIDLEYLKNLSNELYQALKNLENEIHNLAGAKFNISSPKQLGEILFEKLLLDKKKSRRKKTGWSTDINVLEKLENDHKIISLIIEYRILNKLLTTYVDALPQLVETETGRIHTDFNQAVTATGRLSSSNPNLQNIPIRTEFSRRIRKAFLPQEGWKLLSADYSQIELRILAHLSSEKQLQDAYIEGNDIHELTAKMLLNKKDVNPDERRLGKTINFGVIYGMGPLRFARATGVNQSEAKEFLSLYKEKYPKVFDFLEMQERFALSQGYVETIMGRRRHFNFNPNGLGRLRGKDPREIDLETARRGGIEAQQLRAAANAPIQGSSADIIKVAMVNLERRLKESSISAKLLLQVHDELVLEVDPSSINEAKDLVIKTMENSVKLSVPLLVETGIGNNWMDAK